MLKGLEAVELLFSEVMQDNEGKRIDPEFFNKTAQSAYHLLKHHRRFGELIKCGYRVIYENTDAIERKVGVPAGLPFFLQATDINSPFISEESMICVSQEDWNRYPKGRINAGEVLIEVKGRAEKVAIVPDDFPQKTLVTGTIYKMTVRDDLDKYLLVPYLTCRYGQALKNRLKTNLLVSFISKTDLYNLPVPDFSNSFKDALKQSFQRAESLQRTSNSLVGEAETLLLVTLNLADFTPSTKNTNAKLFRESFGNSGRLDAEYYQPKFDELEAKLAASHELVSLKSLLTVNQRGTQPEYAEEGLPVINSKHVREGEVILSDNRLAIMPDKDDALIIKNGDVLINGTGVGTIGRSAPYLHAQEALPDNHVTVLRTDKVNPVFLSVYLNSLAGKYQVDKYFKGSSGQIELYPKDIDCFYVPIVDESIQTEIESLVKQSYTLKAESTRLLDTAKRAVEIAIEQDETAALAYIAAADVKLSQEVTV